MHWLLMVWCRGVGEVGAGEEKEEGGIKKGRGEGGGKRISSGNKFMRYLQYVNDNEFCSKSALRSSLAVVFAISIRIHQTHEGTYSGVGCGGRGAWMPPLPQVPEGTPPSSLQAVKTAFNVCWQDGDELISL